MFKAPGVVVSYTTDPDIQSWPQVPRPGFADGRRRSAAMRRRGGFHDLPRGAVRTGEVAPGSAPWGSWRRRWRGLGWWLLKVEGYVSVVRILEFNLDIGYQVCISAENNQPRSCACRESNLALRSICRFSKAVKSIEQCSGYGVASSTTGKF